MSKYEYRYVIQQEYLAGGQLKLALSLEKRSKDWLPRWINGWLECEFLGFHDTPERAQVFADKHKANGGYEQRVLGEVFSA